MGHLRLKAGGSRFTSYIEGLVSVIGHADRAKPLRDYCLALQLFFSFEMGAACSGLMGASPE